LGDTYCFSGHVHCAHGRAAVSSQRLVCRRLAPRAEKGRDPRPHRLRRSLPQISSMWQAATEGAMTIRVQSWLRTATAITVILTAGLCSLGETAAQGAPATPLDPIVVDSNGAMLGKVVAIESIHTYVAVPSYKNWYLLRLEGRDIFQGAGNLAINFNSFDCSGQAYIIRSGGPVFTPFLLTAFAPNKLLYAETGPLQNVVINSQLDENGECSQSDGSAQTAVPAAPALDLSAFKPPFRVVK
jgi:hypothetical protein